MKIELPLVIKAIVISEWLWMSMPHTAAICIVCSKQETCKWRGRISVTNLSSENNLPMFCWMLSRWWWLEHSVETSAKLFSNIKLVTDNLPLHLCRSQLRSHWKQTHYVHFLEQERKPHFKFLLFFIAWVVSVALLMVLKWVPNNSIWCVHS